MELKANKKIIEIKFNYRMMFKVDKKLATRNQETGASNNDGVGTLFSQILNRDDNGLVSLIKLASSQVGKKDFTDDDAIDVIEQWLEDNEATSTEGLFQAVQDEMVESGFFKDKISKYIDNMKKVIDYLKSKEGEDSIQVTSVLELIGKMENALS